jgi:Kef-type K+ transport system membrane component KefB/nucleotide-binding universal stress UspA family protein
MMSAIELDQLLLSLTLEIALIIATARLLGVVFRRLQQPQVMGEIVAGLLLGPSFLGSLAPGLWATLFPAEALPFLKVISEYGIVLFMFLVGLELDPQLLQKRGAAALVIAATTVIVPFALGAGLGVGTHATLAPPDVSITGFALFLGAAMCVTAFPVLARILVERDLLRSEVGVLALTCAGINDIAGWCVLAFVVALGQAGGATTGMTSIGWMAVYAAAMLWLVRPLLRRFLELFESRGGLSQNLLASVLVLVLASALTTQVIGVHAIFGGFMIGAMMPKQGDFVRALADRTEDFVTAFFLPLYFAYTGLRTELTHLDDWRLWGFSALIIAVAILGKLGGGLVAARAMQLPWRAAAAIGVLMNTRGLMELIILNVGLDLGLITPTVFAMMVVMAIVTTLMASPALAAVYPLARLRAEAIGPAVASPPGEVTILIPVALSSSGPRLLDLSVALGEGYRRRIYALHLSRPVEGGTLGGSPGSKTAPLDALQPTIARAHGREIDLHPVVLLSRQPADDICDVARAKGAELIVMGWHKPVFGRSVLGGTVERVMRRASADVVVFIEKGLPERIQRILLPYTGTRHDQRALVLASRVARHHRADLTLLHIVRPNRSAARLEAEAQALLDSAMPEPATGGTTQLKVVESIDPVDTVLAEAAPYDLTVLGVGDEWRVSPHLFGLRPERIATECPSSLLIVRAGMRG